MKLLKSFSLVAMLGLGVFMAGCGDKSSTKTQEAPIAETQSSGKVLRVAVNQDMPPFVFVDEKGKFVGMDVEIIQAIGKEMGFGVELHTMPWKDLFPSVQTGRYDMAIAGISYNAERAENYGLTKSYMYVPSAIIYNADNPKFAGKTITSLADLKGAKVGGMAAAKQVKQMEAIGGHESMTDTATSFIAFSKMMRGELDATFEDRQLLQYYAKNHQQAGVNLKIVDYESQDTPEAAQVMMVDKSNTELLAKLNEGIDRLTANGTIKSIEQKWMSQQ